MKRMHCFAYLVFWRSFLDYCVTFIKFNGDRLSKASNKLYITDYFFSLISYYNIAAYIHQSQSILSLSLFLTILYINIQSIKLSTYTTYNFGLFTIKYRFYSFFNKGFIAFFSHIYTSHIDNWVKISVVRSLYWCFINTWQAINIAVRLRFRLRTWFRFLFTDNDVIRFENQI